MRIIFPHDPLDKKHADGPFKDEYNTLLSMGIDCSLFDFDAIVFGEFNPTPKLNSGETIIYRGWMMNPSLYKKFAMMVNHRGGKMLTAPDSYISSHHLPEWFESCRQFTPATVFSESEEDLEDVIVNLEWNAFFVKDFVKSNYDERGSIAKDLSEMLEIVQLIKQYRGEIEGGISLREVEEYVPGTEQRYFVLNGKAHAHDGKIPELVSEIAKIHSEPFYSVDTIQRSDGVLRLVELGDGQVSDKKNWPSDVFCQMLSNQTLT